MLNGLIFEGCKELECFYSLIQILLKASPLAEENPPIIPPIIPVKIIRRKEDSGTGKSFTTLEDKIELFSISMMNAKMHHDRNIPINPAQNGERFKGAVKNANRKAEIIKLHQGKYNCAMVAPPPMMITLGMNQRFALRRATGDMYDALMLFIWL